MNFKEGTRRLALLVGGFGVIGGCFGSYLELKSALQQRAMHNTFERLAASDDVTKERKCRLLGSASGCSLASAQADDFADIAQPLTFKNKSSMREDWSKMSKKEQYKFLNSLNAQEQEQFAANMGWKHAPVDFDALAAKYGGVDAPGQPQNNHTPTCPTHPSRIGRRLPRNWTGRN